MIVSIVYFRKLVQLGLVDERLRSKTLNDIAPAIVLEANSWKKSTTSNGPVVILSVIETVTGLKGEQRNPFNLMIPGRFEEECAKIPCLLYYTGKKQIKGGKECHDLKFIKVDDKDVFHDSDDSLEVEMGNTSLDDTYVVPNELTSLSIAASNSSIKVCSSCMIDGLSCPGFCPICGDHLPSNGSGCQCMLTSFC